MKWFIITLFVISITMNSCNHPSQSADPKAHTDSVIAGMNKARSGGEKIEGRFVSMKKITDKTYKLMLQLNSDTIAVFETLMPIGETEISMLKKEGNNIILTYQVYENPVTKKSVKMVRYMEPVYEFQTK